MASNLGLHVLAVTMNCQDVQRVAGFWSALLDLPLREPLPGWRRLGPLESGLLLTFQPVRGDRAGRSETHVDIGTTDGEGAVDRVVELGGALIQEHHYDEGVVRVVADPEGHEFCLVHYVQGASPA